MENKTKMTVTFSRYEYDLIIAEEYPDGSVKTENLRLSIHHQDFS